MGIRHGNGSPKKVSLSPLGEACSRLDLTAIHEILEKVGYKDDDGVANEVSYLHILFHFRCKKSNCDLPKRRDLI